MILFREKYPRWWFDWNLEDLLRFSNRIGTYFALMSDRYPSTDEHQWVRLDFPYPDAKHDLNRWLPLVESLYAIPHYIVTFFLSIAATIAVIVAVVRDPLHRPLPARNLRLRRGRDPLAQPRGRLRLHPRHRPLPAVLDEPARSDCRVAAIAIVAADRTPGRRGRGWGGGGGGGNSVGDLHLTTLSFVDAEAISSIARRAKLDGVLEAGDHQRADNPVHRGPGRRARGTHRPRSGRA